MSTAVQTEIKKKRSFVKPERYRFFLNPYSDARFSRCPECDRSTRIVKLPIFIHVDPDNPVVLNKSCRFCSGCDLLIAHKDELESQLANMFFQRRPDVIGNEYLVIGTFDKTDWERGRKHPVEFDEIASLLYVFKEVLETRPSV